MRFTPSLRTKISSEPTQCLSHGPTDVYTVGTSILVADNPRILTRR